MNISETLMNLLGIGASNPASSAAEQDPTVQATAAQLAAPPQAPAAPGQPTVLGPTPAGAGPAAAMPAPGPAAGAPGAPPAAPPDLATLYQKLMSHQQAYNQIDSGATLVAAGFASPASRAALIGQAGAAGGGSTDPGNTIKTMMELQQMQSNQQTRAAQMAKLPAIAQKYGLDLNTVNQLFQNGKLDELLTSLAKPNTETVKTAAGHSVLINKNTGDQIGGDIGGDTPDNTTNKVVTYADGTIGVINPSTGEPIGKPVGPANAAPSSASSPEKIKIAQDATTNWQQYGYPDPNDPANTKWWGDFNSRLMTGSGGVTINNGGEKAEDAALGTARGALRADFAKQYAPAQSKLDSLNTIATALAAGNGSMYTGPFADSVLKGKEAISGAFGVSLDGTAPTEVAQKTGFALTTAAVKAISSRPTQMEFMKGLENQPGIFLSQAGNGAMINILKQQAESEKQLAIMANDKPQQGENWLKTVDSYYKSHPLMSPFDPSRPMSQSDVDYLKQQADTNPDSPNKPATGTLPTGPQYGPREGYNSILKEETAKGGDARTTAIQQYERRFGPGTAAGVIGQ